MTIKPLKYDMSDLSPVAIATGDKSEIPSFFDMSKFFEVCDTSQKKPLANGGFL